VLRPPPPGPQLSLSGPPVAGGPPCLLEAAALSISDLWKSRCCTVESALCAPTRASLAPIAMEASGTESADFPANPGPEVQPVDTGMYLVNSCYDGSHKERWGWGGGGNMNGSDVWDVDQSD
jgi:hypothetical protein